MSWNLLDAFVPTNSTGMQIGPPLTQDSLFDPQSIWAINTASPPVVISTASESNGWNYPVIFNGDSAIGNMQTIVRFTGCTANIYVLVRGSSNGVTTTGYALGLGSTLAAYLIGNGSLSQVGGNGPAQSISSGNTYDLVGSIIGSVLSLALYSVSSPSAGPASGTLLYSYQWSDTNITGTGKGGWFGFENTTVNIPKAWFYAHVPPVGPTTSPPLTWIEGSAGMYSNSGGTTPCTDGQQILVAADQTGNSNNFTATGSYAPVWKSAILNSNGVMRYSGSTYLIGPGIVPTPSSLSGTYTKIVVARLTDVTVASQNLFSGGGSGSDHHALWYNAAKKLSMYADNADAAVSQTAITNGTWFLLQATCLYNPGNSQNNFTFQLQQNGQFAAMSGQDQLLLTNDDVSIYLGAFNAASEMTGDIAEALLYGQALGGAEMNTMHAYFNTKYALGLPTYAAMVAYYGDSITAGLYQDSGSGQSWAQQVSATYGAMKSLYFLNYGDNGIYLTTMASQAATQVDPLIGTGIGNILVVFAGTNDICLNNVSGATCYTNLKNFCNARTAAGWIVVVVSMLPRGTTQNEIDRQVYNNDIRNNWMTFAQGYCDVETLAMGAPGANTNTTYYYTDQIHPNATGHTDLAGLIGLVVYGLVPTLVSGTGSAIGVATLAGAGARITGATGSATGVAIVSGQSSGSVVPATGAAVGQAIVAGAGASTVAATGSAVGLAVVYGAATPEATQGQGTAVGTAVVHGFGASTAAGVGTAVGATILLGVSSAAPTIQVVYIIRAHYSPYPTVIRGHYSANPTVIQGSRMYPIQENRRVPRGSGVEAWNLTLNPPPISGGYSSWVVVYQVTDPANSNAKVFQQTLTLIDAINGVWQQTFTSANTASTGPMPNPTYNEWFWRTDQSPNNLLLRFGQLQLYGDELEP